MTNELKLLFEDPDGFEVPRNRRFLLKYFDTELRRAFLKYYLSNNDYRNFTSHTGRRCSKSLPHRMARQVDALVAVYDAAKKALTEEGMETVSVIESGKYNLTDLTK